MKVRTTDELSHKVTEELAWRKKELSALSTLIKQFDPPIKQALQRSYVALLYAHWEGFTRRAAEIYLAFVTQRHLPCSRLSFPFRALSLHPAITNSADTTIESTHTILNRALAPASEIFAMELHHIVSPRANIDSKALRQIVFAIGLEYAPFSLKSHLIDERLVKKRNNIAHGRGDTPDDDEIDELRGAIYSMLDSLSEQIQDSAQKEHYKDSPTLQPDTASAPDLEPTPRL